MHVVIAMKMGKFQKAKPKANATDAVHYFHNNKCSCKAVADTGGVALVSTEIPSDNKALTQNRFTEQAQVGDRLAVKCINYVCYMYS